MLAAEIHLWPAAQQARTWQNNRLCSLNRVLFTFDRYLVAGRLARAVKAEARLVQLLRVLPADRDRLREFAVRRGRRVAVERVTLRRFPAEALVPPQAVGAHASICLRHAAFLGRAYSLAEVLPRRLLCILCGALAFLLAPKATLPAELRRFSPFVAKSV